MPPAIVYKKMFALWLLSFDGGALPFKAEAVALKFKEALTYSRVEKVVRLSLTCLQRLLSNRDVADEVVEQGLLQVVQALVFEKRDAELYDDIRSMSAAISTRVAELSNFACYCISGPFLPHQQRFLVFSQENLSMGPR